MHLLFEYCPPLRVEPSKIEAALTIKLQYPGVILPETSTVADCHKGYTQSLRFFVHDSFYFQGDGACAFVQNCVPRLVVKESRHSDALLKTAESTSSHCASASKPPGRSIRDSRFKVSSMERMSLSVMDLECMSCSESGYMIC